ncbi:hypothetical protein [Streptomyces sp. enrichment culture]|uniref:hypothetical protein n=1 Tax=Streptomyces sp. enrichment culture TaxID=1795815 RepID=UPI003F55DE83
MLRLPELPGAERPSLPDAGPDGTFWETRRLLAHAGGRPFVWVDDDLGEPDRAFVASHHPVPTLLRRVDPRYGLRDDDFTALEDFARYLDAHAA